MLLSGAVGVLFPTHSITGSVEAVCGGRNHPLLCSTLMRTGTYIHVVPPHWAKLTYLQLFLSSVLNTYACTSSTLTDV